MTQVFFHSQEHRATGLKKKKKSKEASGENKESRAGGLKHGVESSLLTCLPPRIQLPRASLGITRFSGVGGIGQQFRVLRILLTFTKYSLKEINISLRAQMLSC